MAYTSADLVAIQTARKRGLREVDFGDRRTIYQTDAEMRQVEIDIRRELASQTAQPRQFSIRASKGLGV